MRNSIKCETCGASTYDKIIFEKPKRFSYLAHISNLNQKGSGNITQENICMDCFMKELTEKKELSEKTQENVAEQENIVVDFFERKLIRER